MPGHKGSFGYRDDITEIKGADSLYTADGIIAQSERKTSELFGTRNTFYSTEGSSQVIKAMCFLALRNYYQGIQGSGAIGDLQKKTPTILATRNAHKSFIYASMLLGFKIRWIAPEDETFSLCRCSVSAEKLDLDLKKYIEDCRNSGKEPDVAAVYITSPDYLGNILDIKGIAEVAHKYGLLLLCDNAHGAYLKFLKEDIHPITLGADMTADSAHKTLPVLTGGAYMHISPNAPEEIEKDARKALLMFGSTSPSYLILKSLDEAPDRIDADDYKETAERLKQLKDKLQEAGIDTYGDEALKIALDLRSWGVSGTFVAGKLRKYNIECEYADPDFLVTMWSPYNGFEKDYERFLVAVEEIFAGLQKLESDNEQEAGIDSLYNGLKADLPEVRFQPFEIRYMPHNNKEVGDELIGKVAADSAVGCPPAVSPIVAGEVINENIIRILDYYGIDKIEVLS